MKSLYIKSYAKLNLYLGVLNKRSDSYHNIITLFERINLYDEINLKFRRDKAITLRCNHPDIQEAKSNLAYQAASLLQKNLNINKGVDIKIIKRIPVASGLGGGSSNAAAVLMGLNRLWNLGLTRDELVSYGKQLGADVPFFLYRTPFALGLSRGDQIKTINIKNRFWQVLIVPKLKVSTASIYKRFNRLFRRGALRLTNPQDDVKMLILRLKANNLRRIKEKTFNHLELVVSKLYPRLKKIKYALLNIASIDNISMSGSGPAIFIFVSSRKEGKRLCRQLSKIGQWKTFLVRTA